MKGVFIFWSMMGVDVWTVDRLQNICFWRRLCSVLSIYKGIEVLIVAGAQTIPDEANINSPKYKSVCEVVFGVVWFTIGEMDIM